MIELFENRILWVAVAADILAQVIKVIVVFFTERRWDWSKFFEAGGMPSSHSAFVTSLAIAIGLVNGWDSTLFALAAVFGILVIHEATGVRRAAGLHAQRLNELAEIWSHLFNDSPKPKTLRTLIGHTYPQVLAGMILGAAVSLIAYYWLDYL
ncbi:MAG: divergent PAP2 family protein [Patescibacteria group bacterium]